MFGPFVTAIRLLYTSKQSHEHDTTAESMCEWELGKFIPHSVIHARHKHHAPHWDAIYSNVDRRRERKLCRSSAVLAVKDSLDRLVISYDEHVKFAVNNYYIDP